MIIYNRYTNHINCFLIKYQTHANLGYICKQISLGTLVGTGNVGAQNLGSALIIAASMRC